MARTKRESERRREMADLLVLPRPVESLQNGAGFSGKKLKYTGPAKKKRVTSVLQSEQLARMPGSPLPTGNGTESLVQITKL